MFTIHTSLIAAFLGLSMFLIIPLNGNSQENVSLGCCKTAKGTPACVGCGEWGLKCAIEASLCDEYNSFSLGEYCIDSEIAGEAECRAAETQKGCCLTSQNQCADNVAFNSCGGVKWYDGTACSEVAECVPPAKTSGVVDWAILAAALVIVLFLLVKFRKKKKPAA